MLQINDVSLSFGAQEILDNISFNINSGERVGLVGRNGSGKTSLFKLITGEMRPESGKIVMPRNYTIGYVQQHLKFTEPTIRQEACLGLKEDEKSEVWKAEKILSGLGFSAEDFDRSPLNLSGGYQVRLNLAKVLIAEPHLLLLDEPTNYLDILSIRWLATFLRRWENELMIITHDRNVMNSITTHTVAIHRKNIKKVEGDTIKLYEQIATEEEVYERSRQKEDKARQKTQEFIDRFRAQAARASLVQSRIKALEKMGKKEELSSIAELGFRFNVAEFKAQYMMQVKEMSFGYDPAQLLIKKLSIDIAKDDRICVIGKNGKGKSTFLKLLNEELRPTAGTITNHPNCQRGYFGQTNIERLSPELTIDQELVKTNPDLKYSQIRATCGAMMFTGDLALKKISVLSGGEKSRVSLGKILLTPTNMLLLDEPTNHLDIESCDSLIAALDEFPGAVVIVTHDELFLHHLATRLIVFTDEKVFVFEGTYQEFLDKVGWEPEVKAKAVLQTKAVEHVRGKDDKKARAQLQRDYHKKRKPLNVRISQLEGLITERERSILSNDLRITAAAADGQGSVIKELQIENHAHKEEVDRCYKEMETVISELDRLETEFQAMNAGA
jgi:ATP-binding cassette subfamily F protein 3